MNVNKMQFIIQVVQPIDMFLQQSLVISGKQVVTFTSVVRFQKLQHYITCSAVMSDSIVDCTDCVPLCL